MNDVYQFNIYVMLNVVVKSLLNIRHYVPTRLISICICTYGYEGSCVCSFSLQTPESSPVDWVQVSAQKTDNVLIQCSEAGDVFSADGGG